VEFRRRNVLRPGDVLPAGDRVDTDREKEILKRIGIDENAVRRRGKRLRGKGIGLCLRDIGPGEANIEVGLNTQGKVIILTTVTDTGAGAHTILRQVVAEAMGTSITDIEVISGDTDSFDTDIALGGSRVTYLAGKAAALAAQKLRARIVETAAAKWQCAAAGIRILGNTVVGLRGKKLALADLAREPAADGRAWKELGHFANRERKGTLSYFAQLAEVEIDGETGRLRLLKITCLNDVGTIINPLQHQGQVEGGMVQGLGFTLLEDLPDVDGRIVASNLGEYKIPNLRDVPRLETVNVRDSAGPGPFQSKPIGENTGTPTAAAIANAVYDAIGVQIRDLPITSEKIYFALKNGETQR
jgi:CO/xanthine dehydrogenase Mo-binding subunit